MTSPGVVFYLTCLFLGITGFFSLITSVQATNLKYYSSIYQKGGFMSLKTGDNLTLKCFYEGDVAARFYWYKQSLGEQPRLVSTFYKYEKKANFHDEFNNQRFTLDTEIGNNHLKITDLHISDSATYYCASSYSYKFEFEAGTTVDVKNPGLNAPALVHQSASETIQPGGSVTLNCTVQTGSCDGEHSVYWFKNSEESPPGLIYSHGGRKDQCERKAITKTHTCFYNLPMKSLNLSHAGTYYCAVASCGHILFGDGTKLDIKDELDSLFLLYFLSGALAFTIILIVLLFFLLCMINKRNSCECKESHARFSAPTTTNIEGDQNEENIHYAAVRQHEVNTSRRQKNTNQTECVYSSIKL